MSNAYRNATNIERRLDMLEYERFKEFMPNRKLDGDHQTRARKARAEQKYWEEQQDLLTRAWG